MQSLAEPGLKKTIKVRLQNGLDFETFKKEVFDIEKLDDLFDFRQSDEPEFIIFGPYGNDIPQKGNYTRVGYFCENITPDFSHCEWAFGVPDENEVKNPKYKRIQWHGLAPESLLKSLTDNDIDLILQQKNKFCNFLYSNPVAYREQFYKQLSKYKKIDAPGKSMNNMASIDTLYKGNIWERKLQFLSEYKFTIAFENYAYPGYQTEKLYDAMLLNSLPVYCGDENINKVFNPKSFINVGDVIEPQKGKLVSMLERSSQQSFVDIRPQFFKSPIHRLTRKVKAIGRELKMKLQYNNLDFSDLIDRIIEIDNNQELYIEYLKQPWFYNNTIPTKTLNRDRWIQIFSDLSS